MLPPFSTVPHVVTIPYHKLLSLLHKFNVAIVMNRNENVRVFLWS